VNTTALSVFQNDEFQLQVQPDGDSFIVQASGLAAALGFREGSGLVWTLPDHEKCKVDVDTPGGRQLVWFVREPGFYRALGQRQAARIKDETVRAQVERFQGWVYGEVLPAIRRTGGYGSAQPDLSTPAGILALADAFQRTALRLVEASAEIQELKPKAAAADELMAVDHGNMTIRMTSHELGLKEGALRQFLIDEGMIYGKARACGRREYDFKARYDLYFAASEAPVEHTGRGYSCTHYTIYTTPRGRALIALRLAKRRKDRQAIEAPKEGA
jgi:prophage antirepressor-like protein